MVYNNWLSVTFSFVLLAAFFLVFGVITPSDALQGFANEQLAVILILLVFSDIFKRSSVVNSFYKKVLSENDSPKVFLLKLTALTGSISAFINNTPLLSLTMPYVFDWCKKNKVSPSKFLIPLSFAIILGGMVTLIGTSTTLIINTLAIKSGAEPLGLFDLTAVGLTMLVLGIFYLYTIGYNLMPNNKIHIDYDNQQTIVRQYFMETHVHGNSPIIGKTILEAGLRDLNGLFLVEVLKGENAIRPVSSDVILEGNDILFFAGDLSVISQLDVKLLGLSLPKNCETSTGRRKDMTEVVVSYNSSLIGLSIKESEFRYKFDGAILAIHRNGERIWGNLGLIKLKAGDMLLVMAGKQFNRKIQENNDLYQISNTRKQDSDPEPDPKKVIFVLLGMLVSIGLTAFGLVPFFTSLAILLLLSVILEIVTVSQIQKSLDFNLMIIIGLGLAFGVVIDKSGAAQLISDGVLKLKFLDSKLLVMFLLFMIVNLLGSIITVRAAVAILVPVILKITISMGIATTPIVLLIVFAASANFATPIGYQTNLMVFGPGRYTFKDFIKVGMPLTLIYMTISVLILDFIYKVS